MGLCAAENQPWGSSLYGSCRYCDAKSGATYPTALRPVRFTHHFTTLTAPPNSPLASTCGARAALLSDRAVSSWQALETQPRHSAQRVVKKVLRIAGGRAGRKLWFMAVLAVDKIAFCSRVIGSPGQSLSAAVRCCALVTIAVLPLSGAVSEAVRETRCTVRSAVRYT